jgi:hypothetical protein
VDPADPSRRDLTADEEARRHLGLLRAGTRGQRIAARDALAHIFERRGMLAEATELLENNLREGVRDRAIYTRLALLYRRQGFFDRADEVLAGAPGLASGEFDPAPGSSSSMPSAVDARRPPLLPAGTATRRPRTGRTSRIGRIALALAALGLIPATALAIVALAPGGTSPRLLEPWSSGRSDGPIPPSTVAPAGDPTVVVVVESEAADAPTPLPTATPGSVALGSGGESGCTFVLGFAELRRAVGPEIVGDCVENQRFAEGGDARQQTTLGELVWRKADNVTAFTDGHQTWIVGPQGLQRRLNEDRFAWEAGGTVARASPTPFPLPPVLANSVLPARRIVSYYGNPLAPVMGVLGEPPLERMLARLKEQVDAYAAADPSRPIQPALELVTVVAQNNPGPGGLYRLRMDTDLIEEVARWAESNGYLLILDIQVGRSKVGPEVESLLPFLRRPYVHLALDPEFAMSPTEVPGEVIGTHDAADVNTAIRILADLVTAEQLPPKLLVVHRFTERMLTNYRKVQADSRVQVVVVMDGFGSPELKTRHYDDLVVGQRVQYTGFKLFYQQDKPLMTPKQVLELDPSPDLVIYQ